MSSRLDGLVAAFRAFGSGKELARAGGCSLNTAKRYQRGETSPDVLTLTRLMARSKAIADAVLRLAGLDDLSLDIEQARLVRALADLEQRRIEAHAAVERALAVDRPVPHTDAAHQGGPGVSARQAPGGQDQAAAPDLGRGVL